MRISNFLLWQIAYSELYVTETLWPDFWRLELLRAILNYQSRDRRFGGLSGARARPIQRAPVNAACSKSRNEASPDRFLPPLSCAVLAAMSISFSRCFRRRGALLLRVRGHRCGLWDREPGPLGYAAGLILLSGAARPAALPWPERYWRSPWVWCPRTWQEALPRAAALLLAWSTFSDLAVAIVLWERSPHWLLFALLVNWIGDSRAYYMGRA